MIVTVLAFCDGNKVITTVRTKITGVVFRTSVISMTTVNLPPKILDFINLSRKFNGRN
jgi:hypothetical protein